MKQDIRLTRRAAIRTVVGLSAVMATGACVQGSPSSGTQAGLSVHLAERSAGSGLQPVSAPEGTIYLHPEPLVTSTDTSLSRVLVSPSGGYQVVVQLRNGVPDRIAPVLRDHRGGVLAFLVDGRLVSTQTIGDSSFRGRLTVADTSSKEDADAIAEAI
ncbi:hypothetical protein ACFW16_02040 [Inquilinus sp. NPDC058860]|uniref:hypothetical protein n=1 Tax=Inquilinus sp. NPDC058860 TaxID=3346652 RepID=UPI0036AFEE56